MALLTRDQQITAFLDAFCEGKSAAPCSHHKDLIEQAVDDGTVTERVVPVNEDTVLTADDMTAILHAVDHMGRATSRLLSESLDSPTQVIECLNAMTALARVMQKIERMKSAGGRFAAIPF